MKKLRVLYQEAAAAPRLLDLDIPADAREYVKTFSDRVFHGKQITNVTTNTGRTIHFNNMTDEEAITVARSLYLDIEEPTRLSRS